MRVLVTGHTGFKGAWLSLWLSRRGHSVSGLSLDPEPGSLFERADIASRLEIDARGDVCDGARVLRVVEKVQPEVVIHMAAQSLVRPSYVNPRWTVETNVLGTLSLLEAISTVNSVQAAVIVTTDKVYRNIGQPGGYREDDALGGHDPYSASKAMADILTQSWAASFPGKAIGVARAGNVIGGGDISTDRLMPDVLRALGAGNAIKLRYPNAIRPWQHVLDCLSGYLKLMEVLLDGRGEGVWNFGPDPSAFRSVHETAELAARAWGSDSAWVLDGDDHPQEADLLTLDATRARSELGWTDLLSFEEAVKWAVDWERQVRSGKGALDTSLEQIDHHEALGTAP